MKYCSSVPLRITNQLSGKHWKKYLHNPRKANILMGKHSLRFVYTAWVLQINLSPSRRPSVCLILTKYHWPLNIPVNSFLPLWDPSMSLPHQQPSHRPLLLPSLTVPPAGWVTLTYRNHKASISRCITNPGSMVNMRTCQTWWNGVNHSLLKPSALPRHACVIHSLIQEWIDTIFSQVRPSWTPAYKMFIYGFYPVYLTLIKQILTF